MTATLRRTARFGDGPGERSWLRLHYGDVPVDALGIDDVLDVLTERMVAGNGGYVVTPNVDHLVKVKREPALRPIYERATLCLADGVPLVWLSRLLGLPVAEKVSGSDLLLPLLAAAAAAGVPVFVLGSQPEIAQRATELVRGLLPTLDIVGVASPIVRLEGEQRQLISALASARASGARLVIVALGCPKQEIVMSEHSWRVPEATFVGVGASIDFLAGEVRRAPRWLSSIGLEWAFRLCQEPRRLWRRYLVDAPAVIPIFTAMVARRLRGVSMVARHGLGPDPTIAAQRPTG